MSLIETLHILERGLYHAAAGATCWLLAYFACAWVERRWPTWYELGIPALLVLALVGWKETVDVKMGQSMIKTWADLASWIIGLGLAMWGLYRRRG